VQVFVIKTYLILPNFIKGLDKIYYITFCEFESLLQNFGLNHSKLNFQMWQ
jgi:hypothetical protein